MSTPYPEEILGEDVDNGVMPENRRELADAVVGHRIANVEQSGGNAVITLDNGRRVKMFASDDCCAYTELEKFLLHPERIDHIITGVGTTNEYDTWHIYADMGDVLELTVNWSPGNPFYYGYGFDIRVEDTPSEQAS